MTEPLPPKEEFNTWSEIAGYLGISIREAQAREKEKGMPVRRGAGKKARVWALRSELNAWKLGASTLKNNLEVVAPQPQVAVDQPVGTVATDDRRRPSHLRVRLRWLAFGIAAATAVVGFGLLWSLLRSPAGLGPVRAEVSGSTLSAMDDMDRTIWKHTFPQPLMERGTHRTGFAGRIIQVADLFGNGTRQVLFVAALAKAAGSPEELDHDELYCFSSKGKILWRYKPGLSVTLGGTRFDAPWNMTDILVVPGRPPKIWLGLAHWRWRPGVLLLLNPKGEAQVKFVNAGHLYAINSMSVGSGRYVLAGGINNEYAAASLAILREEAPPSCSPQTPGTRFQCTDIPTANPERYFLFPPTEVSVADGMPYNQVRAIVATEGAYSISVQEASPGNVATAMYGLSPQMEIEDVSFDDGWGTNHVRFETLGLISHHLAECPLLKVPWHIRRWTAASGWATVVVPPKHGVGPDTMNIPQ